MLDRALAIEGFTKASELDLLYRLATTVPAGGLVVEVGSFRGRSTVAIADGMESVEHARLVAVDPFNGDPGWEHQTESREARALFDRNTAHIPFLEVLQAPSVDASQRFEPESIDWLFIDGLHDYRSVRGDIKAWAPKVKAGGLISGHDYGRQGVTDAVLMLFDQVTVEHSVWMTRRPPHILSRTGFGGDRVRWFTGSLRRA